MKLLKELEKRTPEITLCDKEIKETDFKDLLKPKQEEFEVPENVKRCLCLEAWIRILQIYRIHQWDEFFGTNPKFVVATLRIHIRSKKISRCSPPGFHFEKVKDHTCSQECAVAVSNRFGVLGTLKYPGKLWDTVKCETFKVAEEYKGLRVVSRQRLDNR